MITLNLSHLLLLGIVTSALHWLLARSKITEPLWSRATGHLDALLRCPACSGFWLGLAAGALGVQPVTGLPRVWCVFAAGLLALFVTPVFEAVLLWGLDVSAVEEDEPPPKPLVDTVIEAIHSLPPHDLERVRKLFEPPG